MRAAASRAMVLKQRIDVDVRLVPLKDALRAIGGRSERRDPVRTRRTDVEGARLPSR